MSSKAIIVYESKYGNTKLVAEKIVEGMEEVGEIEAFISEVKEVDLNTITEYDVILVGSPNHMGGPVGGIKKFIDKLGMTLPEGKTLAAFDTYLGKDFEKATKKMEKKIGEKVSGAKLVTPGLSIKVDGMKGPVSEGELPKCEEFGKKITAQLKA